MPSIPWGKVPALKHGDAVITEAAAICTYLADEFPHARLNVPIGDPARGEYLKWLFFGPNCVEAAMMDQAAPRKEQPRRGMIGYGDFDTVMDVLAKAVAKGPYLMGEQFTAADVVVGSTLRWGMMFNLLPKRQEFVDYVARLETAPRATTRDRRGPSPDVGVSRSAYDPVGTFAIRPFRLEYSQALTPTPNRDGSVTFVG